LRRGQQLTEAYQLGEYITELRVMPKSPLIGKTLVEEEFAPKHDVTVLELLRDKQKLWSPQTEPLREGDVLLVRGKMQNLMDLKATAALEIAPRSNLVGQTLKRLEFRHRYNAIVLALRRRGEPLRKELNEVRLESSDALLLLGPKDKLTTLRNEENFILLEEIAEPALRRHKVPLALGMATENSGMAEWLARHSLGAVGNFGPVAVLAVLTEFISNNAAAVLLAPIAISTAAELGVSPKPFLVAVCVAASTAFATPVGYQTNAMIHTPGGYKFTDFTKVALPLIAVFFTLAVYFIPKFWPD
jgi:di/tricarboxylate transporter